MESGMVLVEKTNRHFSKFMDALKNQPVIKINDLKTLVARSSFQAVIIKKIYWMNKSLRQVNPNWYLAEPTFSITASKDVFASLKRCDLLEIETKHDFFLLRFKHVPSD